MRSSPVSESSVQSLRSAMDIKSIGELLSEFNAIDQTYETWRKQLRLLISNYELNDKQIRILICSKLKGKALQWFHSCPEHVQMDIDNLLRNMEDTFGQRLSRLDRRRLLEKRQWQKNEHFSDYYY
ncbi:hypothetical protein KPH14_013031, partial [Odynerus spinipes]